MIHIWSVMVLNVWNIYGLDAAIAVITLLMTILIKKLWAIRALNTT